MKKVVILGLFLMGCVYTNAQVVKTKEGESTILFNNQ